MNGKTAAHLFGGVCIVLAILLLAGVITPFTSGILFAVELLYFGILSRGFTMTTPTKGTEQ